MNAYLTSVIENVKKKHGNEPEFVQTVEEVFSSLEPVPRNRLACSAAGGASPVSPSRSHSEHVDPAGRGVLPEVNSCKTEFHKQTCRNISYIVAFSKFEYKEKTSWISISAVSTSWSGR